jgi:lysophospholipase L1-like esterase
MKSKPNRLIFLLLILLAVALVISVTLNIILFSTGQKYYLQLNATRLDPLGLDVYADTNLQITANSQQMRVVFFGDSRASEWTPPAGFNQFQFINRGLGAQTSTQVVERFDDHIRPLTPQVIIVQVCINDLKTIPLFPNQKETIIATCKANIERIVSESLDLEATVILTTIFPLGQIPVERRLFWSPDVAEAINEVNGFIHSLGGERVIIFDTVAILANEQGKVREEYSQDLLHLNDAGYAELNEELRRILATIHHN